MLRHSWIIRELQSSINIGRLRLAQQFQSMDGWQANQCDRFDNYIKGKRVKEYYDCFDQRVERAYRVAVKAHKVEVLNAFKRKLTSSHDKFTAGTMLEMQKAIEERQSWLRDVWAQVDADYRSDDPARQELAAKEISAALHGEPSDYMRWVYELKREERFVGPKQKASMLAEMAHAGLPEVSDEEINRYHNLKLDMSDIERNVKLRYGTAGLQHWAELQAAKDDLYENKLDDAAKVYHELLDQNDRYDESRRTALVRSHVERMHQAQVRFKAAMALEEERDKLIEAHQTMENERMQIAKEERIALLKEAAELKQQGVSNKEIEMRMRVRQLDLHARRQAEYQLKEQEDIRTKKEKYLQYIENFKTSVEEREGLELLRQPDTTSDNARKNVFGFVDEDSLSNGETDIASALQERITVKNDSTLFSKHGASLPSASASQLSPFVKRRDLSQKDVLWKAISADTYESPFPAVHQARLDASKAYDGLYEKFYPLNLVQGKRYSKQDEGEYAAGNGMDGMIFKGGSKPERSLAWGVSPSVVHDLDRDGNTDYFFDGTWHVRDKETSDIDWRYEKKKGGPVFRGPRFYKIGAKREANDPGSASMDSAPFQRSAGGVRSDNSGPAPRRAHFKRASSDVSPSRRSSSLEGLRSS
ncbi:unnamed protein product [Phytomonas sp. Hart1]|nr:unnamed protein product [Phytomonas sp. Hart1]|eukprot:CCW66303.1 unnamed protein product [Phytomonas sp. isolate Hart1]